MDDLDALLDEVERLLALQSRPWPYREGRLRRLGEWASDHLPRLIAELRKLRADCYAPAGGGRGSWCVVRPFCANHASFTAAITDGARTTEILLCRSCAAELLQLRADRGPEK